MSVSPAPPVSPTGMAHERGYHPLGIKAVISETNEAASFVLDVPEAKRAAFAYRAGQFLTFRLRIGDRTIYRSYSMSSAPEIDGDLVVTVKRVARGIGSNWMLDNLKPGDVAAASVPAGVFRLGTTERDMVGFAAGSGITPIISLLKSALSTTVRNARLLYANRDRDSVIFGSALDALSAAHPGRLEVAHHLDNDHGFVGNVHVEPFLDAARTADCYVCGPAPFMDIVESALLGGGVPAEQIHIERFTVSEPAAPTEAEPEPAADTANAAGPPAAESPGAANGTEVMIELDGRTTTTTHHPGTTILQTARQAGLSPPYSCEAGNCATCMAKLLDGEVTMHVNDALFDDEVADGWILTCQSVPTTPRVHVVYGYEGS